MQTGTNDEIAASLKIHLPPMNSSNPKTREAIKFYKELPAEMRHALETGKMERVIEAMESKPDTFPAYLALMVQHGIIKPPAPMPSNP